MAPIPPISLSPMPSPKLRCPSGRRSCGHHPGCGSPEELRAEAAGPVTVVDFCGHVHCLRAVRHLLEHLCLHPIGLKTATTTLRPRKEVGAQEGYIWAHFQSGLLSEAKRRAQEILGAAIFVFSLDREKDLG